MACRTETRQIGDREISVTQWPATKAMLMKLKLVEIFGTSLANLAALATKKEKGDEVAAFSESLHSLFNNNSPEKIMELLKTSIEGVACDGKRLTATSIDQVFSPDDLLEIYKVFLFVIEVNYGNFLKGQLVEGLLAKFKEKVQGELEPEK